MIFNADNPGYKDKNNDGIIAKYFAKSLIIVYQCELLQLIL